MALVDWGFSGGSDGKESTCRRPRFDPWVRKIPWRREWQPTPVFLPGKSHGQRSLASYRPWGHKESDMTEGLTLSLLTFIRPIQSEGSESTNVILRNCSKLSNSAVKGSEPLLVSQSSLTFCDPLDCSLPVSSVREIHQARIREWVAISFSRGSS